MENETCPECGGKLWHNKGISKKTGKPYENWKCGSCDYIKWVGQPQKPAKQETGSVIVLDEVKRLHERLDKMSEWFAAKEKEHKELLENINQELTTKTDEDGYAVDK